MDTREAGKLGGLSRSAAKKSASSKNLARARSARLNSLDPGRATSQVQIPAEDVGEKIRQQPVLLVPRI
jgi:hypothetical protein